MATYGHVIKFERIRQNIKQVHLAKDICTPAYLSKIENNYVVPSNELLGKLFKRLEIPSSTSSISEEDYFKHVQEIYFEALRKKDSVSIAIKLLEILNDHFVFSNPNYFYSYLLMILRLKMISHNIGYDTKVYIIAISRLSVNFDTYQLFIFKSCLGYFHYSKNEFALALESFESALKFHSKIEIKEWEIADFFIF
ncbi:MAG: helix-turn-helix domain-containing protein [Paenisporosarcina sp.]